MKVQNETAAAAQMQQQDDLLISPYITDGQLPPLLKKALQCAATPQQKDMLLMSLLTNCSYALPAMRMYHGHPRHCYGAELMTMVIAPAASGKGVMNYGRRILSTIEGNQGKQVYIPANTSSSALINLLDCFGGRGIIMATEIDTMSQSMSNPFGHFSDVIRCAFEHETISLLRRHRNEFIEIRKPHLSILLSGTPSQLTPLISSRDNGLASRFACYVVSKVADFDDNVWDADADNQPQDYDPYESLSELLGERYLQMATADNLCVFKLTDTQRHRVKRMFRTEYENYSAYFEPEFNQTLKRMPVIMKRIGMVLTGLRIDLSQGIPNQVYCGEEDFRTMLLMGHKLLQHAAMMFSIIPAKKSIVPCSVPGSIMAKQFYDLLPEQFEKSFAVTQANELGVSVKTLDTWLSKWTQKAKVLRIAHGLYNKCA